MVRGDRTRMPPPTDSCNGRRPAVPAPSDRHGQRQWPSTLRDDAAVDKAEAIEVADIRLDALRRRTHAQLVAEWLYQPRSEWATATSGRRYALEIEAVWDDRPNGPLRVWVIVDEGGASWKRPLQRDFIMAPDGSFVDE
jgi:hypothetical protein